MTRAAIRRGARRLPTAFGAGNTAIALHALIELRNVGHGSGVGHRLAVAEEGNDVVEIHGVFFQVEATAGVERRSLGQRAEAAAGVVEGKPAQAWMPGGLVGDVSGPAKTRSGDLERRRRRTRRRRGMDNERDAAYTGGVALSARASRRGARGVPRRCRYPVFEPASAGAQHVSVAPLYRGQARAVVNGSNRTIRRFFEAAELHDDAVSDGQYGRPSGRRR